MCSSGQSVIHVAFAPPCDLITPSPSHRLLPLFLCGPPPSPRPYIPLHWHFHLIYQMLTSCMHILPTTCWGDCSPALITLGFCGQLFDVQPGCFLFYQHSPVKKLDLSQYAFSLNFYFLMFSLPFPSMLSFLTYSESLISLSAIHLRHSGPRTLRNLFDSNSRKGLKTILQPKKSLKSLIPTIGSNGRPTVQSCT